MKDSSQNSSSVSQNLIMRPTEGNRKYPYSIFPSRDHCPVSTVLIKDFLLLIIFSLIHVMCIIWTLTTPSLGILISSLWSSALGPSAMPFNLLLLVLGWECGHRLVKLPHLISLEVVITIFCASVLFFFKWTGFSGGSLIKKPPAMQETQAQSLLQEDPLEKEMVTHSSILVWEIPRTEEPVRLYIVHGVTKAGHDLVTQQQEKNWKFNY